MTSRERFRRIMAFEPVDRYPLVEVESYDVPTVERWRQEGLPPGVSVAEHLGLDMLEPVCLDFWPLPRAEREVLAEDEEYLTVRDELGIVTKSAKSNPAVIYIHLDHPVKERRDWEALKERLNPKDPARYPADWGEAWYERLNSADHPVGLIIHPFFYRLGYYMMGTERFMVSFYDDPQMIRDMFRFWAEFVMGLVEDVVTHVGLDYVAIAEDLAYKSSSFISPSMYEEFWMPYQTPVIRFLREHGVPIVSLWSSGDIRPILPHAIRAGFNATWPLESVVGLHAVELRREYGRSLALAGNISIHALIAGKEAIRREVETKAVPMWKEGGYIPTVDDITPPEVPYENYRYYIELIRQVC